MTRSAEKPCAETAATNSTLFRLRFQSEGQLEFGLSTRVVKEFLVLLYMAWQRNGDMREIEEKESKHRQQSDVSDKADSARKERIRGNLSDLGDSRTENKIKEKRAKVVRKD